MFVPITSEVTLESGMIVKQIATDLNFMLGERLESDPNVLGDDPWELIELPDRGGKRIYLGYLELAQKYFAEVEG